MKKRTIYSYTDSGDLVRCNRCGTDMLVPTGADKCPCCHCEGSLRWMDENRQESTHGELKNNSGYHVVSKNEPEMTGYLSDEVLKSEFDMKKNREETRENTVSSFFYYIWNAWNKQECEATFGNGYLHFWNKWCGICEKHSVFGAAERYYAELGDNYRAKLVSRACEMYDGSWRRK